MGRTIESSDRENETTMTILPEISAHLEAVLKEQAAKENPSSGSERRLVRLGPAVHKARIPVMGMHQMRWKDDPREVEVMAVVGIHAMIRRKGAAPYVCHIKELDQTNAQVLAPADETSTNLTTMKKSLKTTNAPEGGLSSHDLFGKVHVGDKVTVRVHTPNAGCPAGDYDAIVCQEDNHSFAIPSVGPWWFFRADGKSYVGDAEILPNARSDAPGADG